jgi:hypothetical protein
MNHSPGSAAVIDPWLISNCGRADKWLTER